MSLFNLQKANNEVQCTNIINDEPHDVSSNVSDSDPLLDLLILIEKANHYVKEGEWNIEDKDAIYSLKDRFLSNIYTRQPQGIDIKLFYVPYYKYSRGTKDKAGDLMRRDGSKHTFDYYLTMVEPSSSDYEVPGAGTIEMLITYKNITWSFHMLESLARQLNINIDGLTRKEWINQRDFHSIQAKTIQTKIESLFQKVW
jgi:hypothetical protein